jgi:hypothetical protein
VLFDSFGDRLAAKRMAQREFLPDLLAIRARNNYKTTSPIENYLSMIRIGTRETFLDYEVEYLLWRKRGAENCCANLAYEFILQLIDSELSKHLLEVRHNPQLGLLR